MLNSEAQATQSFNFELLDPKTGDLLALGEQTIAESEQDIEVKSQYKAPNGAALFQESYSFSKSDTKLIKLAQATLSNGETCEVNVEGATATIKERSSKGRLELTKIDWGKNYTVGPLLSHILIDQWDYLRNGKDLKVELLVPQMGRAFSYCAKLSKSRVIMSPCSWMLKAFAPDLEFAISTVDGRPQITAYEGPGPVSLAGESNKRVLIRFPVAESHH